MQYFYEHTYYLLIYFCAITLKQVIKYLLRGSQNTESVQRLQKLLFSHVKSQHHRSAYVRCHADSLSRCLYKRYRYPGHQN